MEADRAPGIGVGRCAWHRCVVQEDRGAGRARGAPPPPPPPAERRLTAAATPSKRATTRRHRRKRSTSTNTSTRSRRRRHPATTTTARSRSELSRLAWASRPPRAARPSASPLARSSPTPPTSSTNMRSMLNSDVSLEMDVEVHDDAGEDDPARHTAVSIRPANELTVRRTGFRCRTRGAAARARSLVQSPPRTQSSNSRHNTDLLQQAGSRRRPPSSKPSRNVRAPPGVPPTFLMSMVGSTCVRARRGASARNPALRQGCRDSERSAPTCDG